MPGGCGLNSCLISSDCSGGVPVDGCDGGDNESDGGDDESDRSHQRGCFLKLKVIRGKQAASLHKNIPRSTFAPVSIFWDDKMSTFIFIDPLWGRVSVMWL